MPNLLTDFRALLPDNTLRVGEVVGTAGGVAHIALPDGGQVSARGAATLGQRVFVRAGAIEGLAPALDAVLIEV